MHYVKNQMHSAKKLTFSLSILKEHDHHESLSFAEVFDFPDNINLFNSTERKGASFMCILSCCKCGVSSVVIIDFNIGPDILSNCGLMLLDSAIWREDMLLKSSR